MREDLLQERQIPLPFGASLCRLVLRLRRRSYREDRPCKASYNRVDVLGEMARVTGLEPAASGVTGRRSNQLSYTRLEARAAR